MSKRDKKKGKRPASKASKPAKNTCGGCELAKAVDVVSAAEHPKREFELCADCATLLCDTKPGYVWRESLLVAVEKRHGLTRSMRVELDPSEWNVELVSL